MVDVIVKKSKIDGKGVFATRNFKKEEVVLKWDASNPLSKKDLKNIPKKDMKHVSCYNGKYILMQSPSKYVNHSCNPNTFVKDFSDVANRNIKKGEEITSTYVYDGESAFLICMCGNKKCKSSVAKITNDIIKEIRKNIHPTSKNKKKHKQFIDSYFPGGKAYGTRSSEVRKIAKKYIKELKKDRSKLLKVSVELWKDGNIEPRIIASVFIGSVMNDKKAQQIVKKWVPSLDNWVNADLLMGETKQYWIDNPKETLLYSKKLIKSKNPWGRRFGLIILIFPIRRKNISKKQALDIAYKLKDDKEKYVKKGYIWLLDQISK